MKRFVQWAYKPLPLHTNKEWPRELSASLNDNLSSLERSLISVGQEIASLTNIFTAVIPAGEALSQYDLCYLSSTGEMKKADASLPATSTSLLGVATTDITLGERGEFGLKGLVALSGFSPGDILYVDTTAGGVTNSPPSTTNEVVRIIGYAISSSLCLFDPDKTWLEIA